MVSTTFFKKTTSKQEGTFGIPKKGKVNWSVYILESRLINRVQFFVENELLNIH
ncbi:protein of unknown function [Bacillus velezensis UCMB5113]|nr:protein of unknown function [Bacillus velezensis UCMB5113]